MFTHPLFSQQWVEWAVKLQLSKRLADGISSLVPRLSRLELNDANGTGEPGIFCDVTT